jgi:hypothetical protein
MSVKLSVNLKRDIDANFQYQITENAKRVNDKLWTAFDDGIRAFYLIGSFGTGKSSFLWALQNDLKGKTEYLVNRKYKRLEYIPIVGESESIFKSFANALDCFNNVEQIFLALEEKCDKAGKDGLVLIQLDEFGKHLEYAAKNAPESEVYFMQQLAEFVNDENRNILLIATLHQSFDAYANKLNITLRNEWEKVKGRFKELSFNEPAEALLEIAAQKIQANHAHKWTKDDTQILNSGAVNLDKKKYQELASQIYPLDVLTGKCLVQAFQRYGQNNRSLFSFLTSNEATSLKNWNKESGHYNIETAFNYLHQEFFYYLTTTGNKDFLAWQSILNGLESITLKVGIENRNVTQSCLITIGFLRLFSPKGAALNKDFLCAYLGKYAGFKNAEIENGLKELERLSIVRFRKFENSYTIFEGTDINIESELIAVENRLSIREDIVSAIKRRVNFDPISARRVSFKTGTPRFFEIIPTEKPYLKAPTDELDGVVNLLFSDDLSSESLIEISKNSNRPTIFAHYQRTDRIKETLNEIDKVEQLLIENEEDKAAVNELKKIKEHNEVLLKLYVEDQLTTDKVSWYFNGEKHIITSRKELNQTLSTVIETVFYNTPIFRNELINRHKLSGSIGSAKKNFFRALASNWNKVDLGFDSEKFPPEKTIYLSLLKETGIHQLDQSQDISEPKDESFRALWNEGEKLIEKAIHENVNVNEFFDTLSKAPFGLKNGFLEMWVPTYLFIQRSKFALFEKQTGFQPEINGGVLIMMSRNPKNFEIKSFNLDEHRLNIFNRYREFLQLDHKRKVDSKSFIESIKPFLVFYKGLNNYAKTTKRLNKETIEFRKAISVAKDPEKVFFESFPNALGFTLEQLKDDKQLEDFANKLKICAQELNLAFNELLNRLENALANALTLEKADYSVIQNELSGRYNALRSDFLTTKQKQFVTRISIAIKDRESWYGSIFQTLLGKPLEKITDQEELVLIKNIAHFIKELDNLVDIEKQEVDDKKEELVKLDLTFGNGLKEQVIRIPKKPNKDFDKKEASIRNLLNDNSEWNLAILTKLLKEQMEND